jgi:hypothetical protein
MLESRSSESHGTDPRGTDGGSGGRESASSSEEASSGSAGARSLTASEREAARLAEIKAEIERENEERERKSNSLKALLAQRRAAARVSINSGQGASTAPTPSSAAPGPAAAPAAQGGGGGSSAAEVEKRTSASHADGDGHRLSRRLTMRGESTTDGGGSIAPPPTRADEGVIEETAAGTGAGANRASLMLDCDDGASSTDAPSSLTASELLAEGGGASQAQAVVMTEDDVLSQWFHDGKDDIGPDPVVEQSGDTLGVPGRGEPAPTTTTTTTTTTMVPQLEPNDAAVADHTQTTCGIAEQEARVETPLHPAGGHGLINDTLHATLLRARSPPPVSDQKLFNRHSQPTQSHVLGIFISAHADERDGLEDGDPAPLPTPVLSVEEKDALRRAELKAEAERELAEREQKAADLRALLASRRKGYTDSSASAASTTSANDCDAPQVSGSTAERDTDAVGVSDKSATITSTVSTATQPEVESSAASSDVCPPEENGEHESQPTLPDASALAPTPSTDTDQVDVAPITTEPSSLSPPPASLPPAAPPLPDAAATSCGGPPPPPPPPMPTDLSSGIERAHVLDLGASLLSVTLRKSSERGDARVSTGLATSPQAPISAVDELKQVRSASFFVLKRCVSMMLCLHVFSTSAL